MNKLYLTYSLIYCKAIYRSESMRKRMIGFPFILLLTFISLTNAVGGDITNIPTELYLFLTFFISTSTSSILGQFLSFESSFYDLISTISKNIIKQLIITYYVFSLLLSLIQITVFSLLLPTGLKPIVFASGIFFACTFPIINTILSLTKVDKFNIMASQYHQKQKSVISTILITISMGVLLGINIFVCKSTGSLCIYILLGTAVTIMLSYLICFSKAIAKLFNNKRYSIRINFQK